MDHETEQLLHRNRRKTLDQNVREALADWHKLAPTLTPSDWAIVTLPESSRERRELLLVFYGLGFDYCIRYPDRYELFKNEEHHAKRVRATVAITQSTPPNGLMRVGCGDNLHWLT